MASKKSNSVVIDEKALDTEVKEEVKAEEKVEEVIVDTTVTPKSMNVTIIPTKTFKCHIGNVRYQFEKNKEVKVPRNVETFLRERDLIK